MSLEAAVARVDEIRTMLTPKAAPPAPAPAPAAAAPSFNDVLASALDTTSGASTPSYANPIAAYDTSSGRCPPSRRPGWVFQTEWTLDRSETQLR